MHTYAWLMFFLQYLQYIIAIQHSKRPYQDLIISVYTICVSISKLN